MPFTTELAEVGAYYDKWRKEPIICYSCSLVFNSSDMQKQAEDLQIDFKTAAVRYHARFRRDCAHIHELMAQISCQDIFGKRNCQ